MKNYMLKISNLLELKKISQLELSQTIGKNKNTVSNYLTGKTKIDIETLEDIAKALNVQASYFFEESAEDSGKKIIQNGNHNNTMLGNGNSNTNATKELETCKKELQNLKDRLRDKEEIIELLKSKK